jgi:hypothetical protein
MLDLRRKMSKDLHRNDSGSLKKCRGVMSEKLLALIEKTRHIKPTPAEEREQEIGFAYGNVHFENPRVTRELVERSLSMTDDGLESDR